MDPKGDHREVFLGKGLLKLPEILILLVWFEVGEKVFWYCISILRERSEAMLILLIYEWLGVQNLGKTANMI